MNFIWSDENIGALAALKKRYPDPKALVLPALWKVQEQEGFISREGMEAVAELTGRSRAEVYGVATFYTMFHLQPIGTYHIQLCKTLSCALNGKESVLQRLQNRLGIDIGETTPDGRFTLSQVECLGACGTGPVMQINDTLYAHLTPDTIDTILKELP